MAFRFVQCNQDFNRANVKSHNSGMLGLGTSRNVLAFQMLCGNNVVTERSLVSC